MLESVWKFGFLTVASFACDILCQTQIMTIFVLLYNTKGFLRHLLLGRKAMTILDSIVKSRDITLPTKVRLVKAMIFPVVMCGCESWTVKKAEH